MSRPVWVRGRWRPSRDLIAAHSGRQIERRPACRTLWVVEKEWAHEARPC